MRPAAALLPLLIAACPLLTGTALAEEPVALHLGSLIVSPSHTPPVFVTVRNLTEKPYEGVLRLKVPEGWTLREPQIEVALGPRETQRAAFTVSRGALNDENRYALEVSAQGAGTTVTRKQEIACCSAPYFKPQIDGDPADWKDAIPVTFDDGGKTTIRTFWNRRTFCVLVAVEEEKLVPMREEGPFDAVQIAIAPEGAVTGESADDETARYELLLAPGEQDGAASCYLLAQPGMNLAETQRIRPLADLAYSDAEVAVARQGGTTIYECAIPFKLVKQDIRPGAGREFCFSVLVHDEGSGLRDWGRAAGLWPSERKRLAWSTWKGGQWPKEPPFDNKLPWGLCSSKY